MELLICPELQELSRRAAELFIQLAGEAISVNGRFSIALSGGSTPRVLYSLLAKEPLRSRISWTRVHFFWGDERPVPPDHPESNFRMAHETLLARLQTPAENIHRIEAELQDPQEVAARYEDSLRRFFASRLPRFDLILLGMGEDGHVASLFPDSPALKEKKRLVVANYVKKLEVHRFTATFPLINAAARIMILVSGESKSAALQELILKKRGRLPAEMVQPTDGKVVLLADRAAGSRLEK